MNVEIVALSGRALLQDAGRPGRSAIGVGESGVFDRRAARQANALVGNGQGAAVLEVMLGGLTLRAGTDLTLAVTGAVGPLTTGEGPVTHGRAVHLRTGQTLTMAPFGWGLRACLAVAGGWAAQPVLGSLSSDTLAGLGPAPLAVGDVLPVGAAGAVPDLDDVLAVTRSGDLRLDVVPGPRHDWFTSAGVRTLLGTGWVVTSSSDRIGVRLDGPAIEHARSDELPSEPCVRGSIQVTGDGRPVVLGPDHPVTGGYPVIGVVTDAHVDLLAQARPGDVVRFTRA